MKYLKEDILRYFTKEEKNGRISLLAMFWKVITEESLWVITLYRYGRWLHTDVKVRGLRLFLKVPYSILSGIFEMLLGIHIPWMADIGEGLYIGHYGGIWIGPVKMGRNVNISHEVTIGFLGKGKLAGVPEIGDRVYIGPGAKIFGRIRIGNDVAIGANAVVSKNLPDRAVAVGNPARIVSHEGSEDIIEVR